MKSIKSKLASVLLLAVAAANAQTTTTTITTPSNGGQTTTTSTSAKNKADNTTSRAFSFGVKGGVNFASVIGHDIDSPKSRTSFHAGLIGEMPLSDMFSVQVEALYSSQGFEEGTTIINPNPGGFGNVVTREHQIDYINVPILAKFYATKGLSIEAGPQFNFKVNEEKDIDPNVPIGSASFDDAEDFGIGAAAGLTFQTEIGIFASGRYSYGFTDILKTGDVHNSVFQISVGYKF